MRIKITLSTGLAITALAVFVVLQRSPETVVATNGVRVAAQLGFVQEGGTGCQDGESLPQDVSAIRLSFTATTGPQIVVTVLSGKRIVTSGTIGSGWYGSSVTIALRPLHRGYSDVRVCESFGSLTGVVGVLGDRVRAAKPPGDNAFAPGRMSVAYLRPGDRSWWSLAGSVVEHMALGRAASGIWIVFSILTLIAGAIALASLALIRELR